MGVSPARRAAFDILLRVETDGAFSDELLHSARTEALDERDRGLVFELVLGCLRRQGELDDRIARLSRRAAAKLDAEVRVALRLGCYQLGFLSRVPAHAAVSESVALVRRARKHSAAGLVNAVLRRVADGPGKEAASPERSHPEWLRHRWSDHFGEEAAGALVEANLKTPKSYLRLNARFPLEETVDQLRREGVETESTEIPGCRLVVGGRASTTGCLAEARVHLQDISSQMVVPLLDLRPGLSFLDVCAAPGGKTRQAVESLCAGEGRLGAPAVACDLHLHRIAAMGRAAGDVFDRVVADARNPLPFRRLFDRVLVDAPCSGTGTLARNPEIKWRLKPGDLVDLQAKQRRILSNALDCLAPGGVLVYSTCSVEPEENRQVAERVLRDRSGFRAVDWLDRLPGRDAGDGFFACKIVGAAPAG